jgi:hypothetical protein
LAAKAENELANAARVSEIVDAVIAKSFQRPKMAEAMWTRDWSNCDPFDMACLQNLRPEFLHQRQRVIERLQR